jgi:hypothetical protein
MRLTAVVLFCSLGSSLQAEKSYYKEPNLVLPYGGAYFAGVRNNSNTDYAVYGCGTSHWFGRASSVDGVSFAHHCYATVAAHSTVVFHSKPVIAPQYSGYPIYCTGCINPEDAPIFHYVPYIDLIQLVPASELRADGAKVFINIMLKKTDIYGSCLLEATTIQDCTRKLLVNLDAGVELGEMKKYTKKYEKKSFTGGRDSFWIVIQSESVVEIDCGDVIFRFAYEKNKFDYDHCVGLEYE